MTKTEIAALLNKNFFENFAKNVRDIIIRNSSVNELFGLIQDLIKGIIPDNEYYGSKRDLPKTEFRAAYVLEYIYFFDHKFFKDIYNQFFELFPLIKNGSTKRHFAKIATHILKEAIYIPYKKSKEDLAGACLEWIASPKVKVAVKVWAVETLLLLKDEFKWVGEALNDLVYDISLNPTPGMKVRLRKWKQIITLY